MSTVKGIAARNVLMSGQSGRRENCNKLQKSLVDVAKDATAQTP